MALCLVFSERTPVGSIKECTEYCYHALGVSHDSCWPALLCSSSSAKAQRNIAYEARTLIDEQLLQPPTLLELSKEPWVGETPLRRLFKAAFAITVRDYTKQQHMELARQWLRQQQRQIAQVAYCLGRSDPANLPNAYRAYF